MNYKTTKKAIINGYSNVIYTGYCNLENLLCYRDVESHTERAEGWGADIYRLNYNTCIVTGYAPFGNIHADYDTVRKYNDMAQEITTRRTDYADAKSQLDALINQFVAEVTA